MKMTRYFFLCFLAFAPQAFADPLGPAAGFGFIADNLFGTAVTVQHLIQALCILAGVGLLVSGLLQFQKYRKNPVEVSLGMPIMSCLTGLALIGLSFIPMQM